eukprot:834565-Pyramimonas_sp.AAC.1
MQQCWPTQQCCGMVMRYDHVKVITAGGGGGEEEEEGKLGSVQCISTRRPHWQVSHMHRQVLAADTATTMRAR